MLAATALQPSSATTRAPQPAPATLSSPLEAWLRVAKAQLHAGTPPENFFFLSREDREQAAPGELALDYAAEPSQDTLPAAYDVPSAFRELAKEVAPHRNPHRWQVLYRVLWRLSHGESRLLERQIDPDRHELEEMRRAVLRDVRRVLTHVRFLQMSSPFGSHWICWNQPEHHSLSLVAPKLVRRFGDQTWSLMSNETCVHWLNHQLFSTDGVNPGESRFPSKSRWAGLWRDCCLDACLERLPRHQRWEIERQRMEFSG